MFHSALTQKELWLHQVNNSSLPSCLLLAVVIVQGRCVAPFCGAFFQSGCDLAMDKPPRLVWCAAWHQI